MSPYYTCEGEGKVLLGERPTSIKFKGDDRSFGEIRLNEKCQGTIEVFPRGNVTVWTATGEKKDCIIFPDEWGVNRGPLRVSEKNLFIRNDSTGEEIVIVYSEKPVGGK